MLSPLDDRYHDTVVGLEDYFSEKALWEYRLQVELKYLRFVLTRTGTFLSEDQKKILDNFKLTDDRFRRGKLKEAKLRHDIKALEGIIREDLLPEFGELCSFIHFGLTSEDVNNIAQAMMVRDAINLLVAPFLLKMISEIREFANATKDVVMLARTHGQPAVPTTLGRELFVHLYRMTNPLHKVLEHHHCAKLGGAIGCLNAHRHVFPDVDWNSAIDDFLYRQGLTPEVITTQVSGGQKEATLFYYFVTFNNVLIDFCRDIWMYASLGYIDIKKIGVGSSTMPHKSNPIEFENAEGNLGLANALFSFFADNVTKSRLQRDLSGSTVKRNLGVAFGHSFLAYRNIKAGMFRLSANTERIREDLLSHPEVYSEALQQTRRASGDVYGYEEVAENIADCKPTEKELFGYTGYAIEQAEEMYVLIGNFLGNYHYDLSIYGQGGTK